MERLCLNCDFWYSLKEATDESLGQCRFNPPTVVATKLDTSKPEALNNTSTERAKMEYRWPFTKGDDWCGRFIPKQS